MITSLAEEDLLNFELDIASEFDSGNIKAPVHLHNGNETQILEVFKDIREEDWVFSTWRSHYHCLLKGVPVVKLKKAIMDHRSIGLCFPEYKIYSSGIVTGSIPTSVGVAMNIKRLGKKGMVYCFVGDMGAETGSFHESYNYSVRHDLPIMFIIEDNGVSVCTDTNKTWNKEHSPPLIKNKMIRYIYKSKWPHAGAGSRVQF